MTTEAISTDIATPSRFRWRRFALMVSVPAAALLGGAYFYVFGARYVSTDNAYIHQDKVTISTDIAGRITEVTVRENQPVKKGDVLFRIDEEPYRLVLQADEANARSARLKIEQLRVTYADSLASQKAAQETLAYWQSEFQRQQRLIGGAVTTQSKYDEVRHTMQDAQQKLINAQQAVEGARVALAGDPTISPDQHPMVLEALAKRDQARRDLEHTVIRAPEDGVVSQTDHLLIGQYMSVGTAALSLVESDRNWIEANFKETDLTHMHVGQTAAVSLDVYPDRTLTAVVDSIGAGTGAEFSVLPAQNATGNWVKVVQRVPVRLRIEKLAEMPLRTGLSANVEVDTGFIRSLPGIQAYARNR